MHWALRSTWVSQLGQWGRQEEAAVAIYRALGPEAACHCLQIPIWPCGCTFSLHHPQACRQETWAQAMKHTEDLFSQQSLCSRHFLSPGNSIACLKKSLWSGTELQPDDSPRGKGRVPTVTQTALYLPVPLLVMEPRASNQWLPGSCKERVTSS